MPKPENARRVRTSPSAGPKFITWPLAGLEPRQRKAIDARKRSYFDFLRATLEQLKERGQFRPDLGNGRNMGTWAN